jgi:transglutaminase-like putative cysteine protease
VALLVTGFGLKSLEMYKKRDALVVIYVAYLVSATAFLFDQSILMAIYVFAVLLVCTTALLSVNLTKDANFMVPFKRTVLLVLPTIPLMVVLFVLVPRIGPLWQMGLDNSAAKTGLSEQMSPGDITKLTRSAETAFRVTFEGEVPAQKDLYWRAIVMNDFDGRTWYNEKTPEVLQGISPLSNVNNTPVSYEVIMEASERKYIPALEQLTSLPAGFKLRDDLTLIAPATLRQRSQYQLTSSLTDRYQDGENLFSFSRQLILPEGNNRARQQAQLWWQATQNIESYLDKILQNYNQSFVYTLQPPVLFGDQIDQFLFETQQGFCGHFSSATAFMLRAVGIPARVVTGYQGGEWNPYENYLLVRQYDAHAWVEYWTEGSGWIRVDPTAYVAPERIEQPSDETLGREDQFLADNPFFSSTILSKGLLASVRLRMEALNYGWHRWVLGYHHQQHAFLAEILGNLSPLKLALFLLIPFALIITATTLMIIRNSSPKSPDPTDRLILLLSEHMKKQGLQRQPGETVQNYCLRVGDVREELAAQLLEIGTIYEQIRYAGFTTDTSHQRLSELIKGCCK